MKVLVVISSANHEGYGAKLAKAVVEQANIASADVHFEYIYDLNFKSCGNCQTISTEPYWCSRKDDLVPVLEKLIEADLLIWAAPIYMDYLSGTAKTFLDRFCIFVNQDFTINRIIGKKVILIITSGAPAENYQPVSESIRQELTEFFKMDVLSVITAGGFMKQGMDFAPEVMVAVRETANRLI
jgi:multimeric flavodoxin WrbA